MSIPANVGKNLENKSVLVLWSSGTNPEDLQNLVSELNTLKPSSVALENVERLLLSSHSNSTFQVALLNFLPPHDGKQTLEILAEILRILTPNGILYARRSTEENEKLLTTFKLAGYKNVQETDGESSLISAEKPNFEVGSSSKLSFATSAPKPSVWTLSDNLLDDDVGLVDESELLNEEDLVTPSEASLRVCGTTGKRKACKNCSCGLAEELEQTAKPTNTPKAATSACGSCYLGDAFRCASCPYLGMPAFKPGEKIQIPTGQLKPDV
nr:EOG090X0FGQ [Eulimnadia texana]